MFSWESVVGPAKDGPVPPVVTAENTNRIWVSEQTGGSTSLQFAGMQHSIGSVPPTISRYP